METAAQGILGIKYKDLAYGTSHGFATYSSNDGHNGTSGLAVCRNEEVVTDLAWRAYVAPLSTFFLHLPLFLSPS
jgi:feruloyl esterase